MPRGKSCSRTPHVPRLEEKLRAEVARGRESVPAAQTAKDLAADAAKLTLVEAQTQQMSMGALHSFLNI